MSKNTLTMSHPQIPVQIHREREIINFSLTMFSKVKILLSYLSAFLIADVFGFFGFALNQAANYSILEF